MIKLFHLTLRPDKALIESNTLYIYETKIKRPIKKEKQANL